MNTKLTLTIEQVIVERAKNYAKEKNRSLSYIIENYLKLITKEELKQKNSKGGTKLNPIVKDTSNNSFWNFNAGIFSSYKKPKTEFSHS